MYVYNYDLIIKRVSLNSCLILNLNPPIIRILINGSSNRSSISIYDIFILRLNVLFNIEMIIDIIITMSCINLTKIRAGARYHILISDIVSYYLIITTQQVNLSWSNICLHTWTRSCMKVIQAWPVIVITSARQVVQF